MHSGSKTSRKNVRKDFLFGLTYKFYNGNEMPFYTYITTNPERTTLYIGMTNALSKRLKEHYENRGDPETFAGRYYCYKLIYYETYSTAQKAIEQKKKLKSGVGRRRKSLLRK
jgi:putative endonuclease